MSVQAGKRSVLSRRLVNITVNRGVACRRGGRRCSLWLPAFSAAPSPLRATTSRTSSPPWASAASVSPAFMVFPVSSTIENLVQVLPQLLNLLC